MLNKIQDWSFLFNNQHLALNLRQKSSFIFNIQVFILNVILRFRYELLSENDQAFPSTLNSSLQRQVFALSLLEDAPEMAHKFWIWFELHAWLTQMLKVRHACW